MLTIGLPFYNNQKTLANAIRSVLVQSYKNWELILIDDGSTDRSFDIANEFAKTDHRIKLISDGVNRGLVYRLNQIIDLAIGEYIARMDSDDMMMPNKLEKQMEALEKNNSIDVIDTAVYTIDENDEPTGMRGIDDLSTWDKRKAFKNVLLFHPTVVAKTALYKKNKYDKDFIRSEDFELWCRTFDNTVFARVYEPLFLYREGKVNIKAYTTSNRSHRMLLRKHGSAVLSKTELVSELVKSHLKSSLYRIFAVFNMQHKLSSKRNIKLSISQVNTVKIIIEEIKNMEIIHNSDS
ncbi:MAG: glycosyltransferase family 2 protein [Chitinophagaceae bacterium]|nr:glycosyltransferase family 2 protein [Chitinophagaceae bacterium]